MLDALKIESLHHQDAVEVYRRIAAEREKTIFNKKASFSKDHERWFGLEEDHRLPYKRDVDRILHSKAYARYIDKTQVVYLVENDHITHRSLHVQLVSNFSRGIGEVLGLNVDLIEAISLGHDVGHPPFGHEGEGYLSALSQEYGNGAFAHPWQSCRLFFEIEPLNLGLAVYDGFLCHDGGIPSKKLIPRFGKRWESHFNDLAEKLKAPEENIWPGSLEGCLVKLCDTLSYLGRDIEDAVNLGILNRENVPKTFLGNRNKTILTAMACDIIVNSYGKDYIEISEEALESIKVLRKFNFENIYTHPKLKVESEKIKQSYRILFEMLLNDLLKKGEKSYAWIHFLSNKSENYLTNTAEVQKIVDYISGMTDKYFVRTLQALLIPKQIELH